MKNFGYFFKEGARSMFSHGFMSFAAIGVTVACLLIMGTFTLVAVNANALLLDLEQENEILAYVDDSYTSAQAKALQKELEAIPNVASATYISKEQATEDFAADYPDEELFQDLDPAILRDRFGGKGAKAAIVTTEVCNAAARHRAAQLGIAVIDLEELKTGQIVHRLKVIMKAE